MKRKRWRHLALPLAILAGAAVFLLYFIDDWGRDFTTNQAETSAHAANPAMRPLESDRPTAEVAEAVRIAAERLGNWELKGVADEGKTVTLFFVRTTRVFRLKNDVTLHVRDLGDRRTVGGSSQSRVGKGDLGQNPRNLQSILAETRSVLEETR